MLYFLLCSIYRAKRVTCPTRKPEPEEYMSQQQYASNLSTLNSASNLSTLSGASNPVNSCNLLKSCNLAKSCNFIKSCNLIESYNLSNLGNLDRIYWSNRSCSFASSGFVRNLRSASSHFRANSSDRSEGLYFENLCVAGERHLSFHYAMTIPM